MDARSLEQDHLGRGESLAAEEARRDCSDMKGTQLQFQPIHIMVKPTFQMKKGNKNFSDGER